MPTPSGQLSPLHLLLIEDNARDAELARIRLELSGLKFEFAHVSDEAGLREALSKQTFDVVLSDFMLPGFSGTDALAICKSEAPETPFIFVSGVLGEENAIDMLRQGAVDYVLKQRLQSLPVAVKRAIAETEERRQRIRAQSQLREYEQHFHRLFDALHEYAVIGLSPAGDVRSWNAAAERLLGYRAEDVIDEPCGLLFQASDIGDAAWLHSLRIAQRQGSHVADRWMKNQRGEDFYASVVTTAIRGDAGSLMGYSTIIRDTTDQRRAAESLQKAKEDAEAANAAKDRFLAMLSHELRTPLTPILAASRLLEQTSQLSPQLADLLSMIRRNVELEARLIDDLLDITTITHNKLSLTLETVDLHDCCRRIVEMARADIERKQLHIELRLEAVQHHVRADAARVHQVIWNLVRNAVKFTPAQGSVRIESVNPEAGAITLSVSDTGIGISDAALPRIFSAFEQADSSITHDFGGLGLGLAIAQALAQKHGGSLTAESSGAGRGARFTFRLPLPELPSPQALQSNDAASAAPIAALRVLLVEDNADTAQALGALLELSGHTVSIAATMAEAIKHIDGDTRFSLLVSDVGLPDGDGTQVVRAFSERHNAPSIAITGYGMGEDVRRCLDAGFSAHATKPVSFEHIEKLIQELIAQHQAQGQGAGG